MFKGFKAVLWCHGVVACKDNNKVDRCRDNGVINRDVNRAVDSLKGWLVGLWIKWCSVGNEKTLTRALPNQNR